MSKKLTLLLFTAILFAVSGFSQKKNVSGRVTDVESKPLVGASITIKGTNQGITTKEDGTFIISVPSNSSVLVFSFSGLITEELAVGNKSTVNMILKTEEIALQEVVVVGYGTQRKKDVTAAVSSIGGEKIRNQPAQSFDQLLAGKAAGMNITLPNGVLNNPPVIRIRGTNSISLSSFPLVVIDGVPITTGDVSTNNAASNPLAAINPNDIEDIQVLKDAAAAAIFGSRAANGVLIITTRKGKTGKARVTYDAWIGQTSTFRVWDILDADQYLTIKNEARANAGQGAAFFKDSLNGQPINTRWYDQVFRKALQHNHTFSVSGANAGTRYFMSAGYSKQDGMIKRNTFERKQMRLNLDQKVNNWLKVGTNLGFTRSTTESPNTGALPGQAFNTSGLARLSFLSSPIVSPFNADGSYNIMTPDNIVGRNTNNQLGRGKNLDRTGLTNPTMLLDLNKFNSTLDQLLGVVNAEVTFAKGVTYKTQYGTNYQSVFDESFLNPLHGDGINTTATTDDGSATNTETKITNWTWQHLVNYDFKIKSNHSFNILAGAEETANKTVRWGINRQNVSDVTFDDLQAFYTINNPANNLITENYLLSYFGRINYDFKKKYFLSLNLRRDGYSAYAKGKKWGNFWGASAGWNISDESFWKGGIAKVVNSLRLRASFGMVGNTGVDDFASFSQFSGFQYGNYPTLFFGGVGNPSITWESVTKKDIGVQFGLFNDRITGEIGYYDSDAKDLIINLPVASSMGLPGGNVIPTNVASMYNRGFEFSINAKILTGKALKWDATLNITTQQNKVTKLANSINEIPGVTVLEQTNMTRIGFSIGQIYGIVTTGVNPLNGQRIFLDASGRSVQYNHAAAPGTRYTYLDGTLAPSIDPARDGKMLGNTQPKLFGGIVNNISYKFFDLSIDAIFSTGNYIYNGSRAGMLDQRFWNNSTEVLRRWQLKDQQTDIPRVVYNDNISNGSAFLISSNVEKGDFIKIRTITLGVTLPSKIMQKLGISSMRYFTQVFNAAIFTKYKGSDPEVSTNGNRAITPGVDRNTMPQARTITFGISVGF